MCVGNDRRSARTKERLEKYEFITRAVNTSFAKMKKITSGNLRQWNYFIKEGEKLNQLLTETLISTKPRACTLYDKV